MAAEATKCHHGWTEDDDDKCKKDCMAEFRGVGKIHVFTYPYGAYVYCECEFDC